MEQKWWTYFTVSTENCESNSETGMQDSFGVIKYFYFWKYTQFL